MKKRSVPMAILFCIITLGIYYIYWYVCLTNDTNELAKTKTASGVAAVVYTIITLGFYTFYWSYMTGIKEGEISGKNPSGIFYLALTLFGLGFMVPILTQNTINNAIESNEKTAYIHTEV